jgi:hypothetical protein
MKTKLNSATLGVVRNAQGKEVVFSIPAGSMVERKQEVKNDGTVDVQIGDIVVNVFEVDLQKRERPA